MDSTDAARAVAAKSSASGDRIPTLIEVDSDGRRAGVQINDTQRLVDVGRILHEGGAELIGVMTHAGGSYDCCSDAQITTFAEQERLVAVRSAGALRQAGLPAPIVSALAPHLPLSFAEDLTGVTEVRAGTFVFFDLFMSGLGVCKLDDIAISVLAIGRRVTSATKGWILVDAGWMAMSRDRGTAKQRLDQGYGLVCDLAGRPYIDLVMIEASQEQGILEIRPGSDAPLPDLPVGSLWLSHSPQSLLARQELSA